MAVPKGKTSRMKKNQRRSHDALRAPASATCPRCRAVKAPHRVCGSCGSYKGREIIPTDKE